MQEKEIAGIVRRQKAYFAEGRTLPVPCRLAALGRPWPSCGTTAPICAAGRSPGYVWPGRPTFRGWRPGCLDPMGWR